jgi:hypothetical protein
VKLSSLLRNVCKADLHSTPEAVKRLPLCRQTRRRLADGGSYLLFALASNDESNFALHVVTPYHSRNPTAPIFRCADGCAIFCLRRMS